jgi:aminomuconate-semialdehyde/2-hydroxymuconate-6-semialdehyde dehydrogenase
MSDSHVIQRVDNFIGGAFVRPAGLTWLADTNPATGEHIADIARSDGRDADAAVSAARDAITGPWASWSVAERADLLDTIASLIERRMDDLVILESQDTGKPVHTARTVDIARAVSNFRFFAGAVRHYSTDAHSMPGALNYTLRRPLGVVTLITPWNLPLYLATWKIAPALAMGNAVVCKPSELTPLTANALAEIAHDAGVPDGVFNVVHGHGYEVGQALCEHPGVKAISFTGGTSTGALVAAAAAPTFKKVSLELGGKNPTIVFADCDFDATIDGVLRASFANQGQVCLCGERVLVERSILDRFTDALASRAAGLSIGDPLDPATRFGAQISHDHRAKIEGYVALAKEEGGTVVHGGKRPLLPAPLDAGAFFEPTIISGLPSTSRTATEEIFGPVVTLHPFDSDEQAVAMANEVDYGLSASVWTNSLGRAHRIAEQLDAGTVWVNTWLKRDLRVPFGGMKRSGLGREGGRYSLEFFSEPKNVCIALD